MLGRSDHLLLGGAILWQMLPLTRRTSSDMAGGWFCAVVFQRYSAYRVTEVLGAALTPTQLHHRLELWLLLPVVIVLPLLAPLLDLHPQPTHRHQRKWLAISTGLRMSSNSSLRPGKTRSTIRLRPSELHSACIQSAVALNPSDRLPASVDDPGKILLEDARHALITDA